MIDTRWEAIAGQMVRGFGRTLAMGMMEILLSS